MAALGMLIGTREGPVLAACCRITLPIADIQHENPRGVGEGCLVTRSGPWSMSALRQAERPRPTVSITRAPAQQSMAHQ